mgnify:CR=1 FL=1
MSFFLDEDEDLYGAPRPIAWIGMELDSRQRKKIEEKMREGFGVDVYTDDSDMALYLFTVHSMDSLYWRTRETFTTQQSGRHLGQRFVQ